MIVQLSKAEIAEACLEWCQKHHGLTIDTVKFEGKTNAGGYVRTLTNLRARLAVTKTKSKGPYR